MPTFFLSLDGVVKKISQEVPDLNTLVSLIRSKFDGFSTVDAKSIIVSVSDTQHNIKYSLEDPSEIQEGTLLEVTLKTSNSLKRQLNEMKQQVRSGAGPKKSKNRAPAQDDGNFIVKLLGLPYSATKQDINEFFQGVNVVTDSVWLAVNLDKRPLGVAFLQLADGRNRDLALAKNGGYMGSRYVEVIASNQELLNRAQKRAEPWSGLVLQSSNIVKLRGLPFSAGEGDILKFFSGITAPVGVHIVFNFKGQASGEAFAEFKTEEGAQAALGLNKKNIRHRYIDLSPSSHSDLIHAMSGADPTVSGGATAVGVADASSFVVRLSGIPFSSNEAEISAFLNGVATTKVHIIRDVTGRPSGDALVEVKSEDVVQEALAFNRKYMGSRYVNVSRSSVKDLSFAIQGSTPGSNVSTSGHVVRLNGLPFSAGETEIRAFLNGVSVTRVMMTLDDKQRSTGVAYVEVGSEAEVETALSFHKQYIGQRYVEVFRATHMELQGAVASSAPTTNLSSEYLLMRGMPYNSTDKDIAAFFAMVHVTPTHIHRKQGGGDAYIAFTSPAHASRAFGMNRKNMGRRYIELTSVSYEEMAKLGLGGQQPQFQQQQLQQFQQQPVQQQQFGAYTHMATPQYGQQQQQQSTNGAFNTTTLSGYQAPTGGQGYGW